MLDPRPHDAGPLTPLLQVERLSKRYPVAGRRGALLLGNGDRA